MTSETADCMVARWTVFELRLHGAVHHPDPLREVRLCAVFSGPAGEVRRIDGFWNGGNTWCVRFAPDLVGEWTYATTCDPAHDARLHDRRGRFRCTPPMGGTRFERHGPLRVSTDRRHLEHADGTPFFWVGDTAWNGPLHATTAEWDWYLRERTRQTFNAVQWVATQWLGSPDGDRDGRRAFTGRDRVAIDVAFFQRLDARAETAARAGFLNVPVLLWSAVWSTPEENAKNPGVFLPEAEAVLLARYMVARWGAWPVVWILAGDGDYRDARAERWRRIGRAVFGDAPHAPVMLHPAGMQWDGDAFRDEPWLDLLGYQSGHGDDRETFAWLVSGPPASDWKNAPARPVLNLEPPYEDHLAHQSRQRIDAAFVRRALYWSLLVSPTAGVSYGGHGVWGWDEGVAPTAGHPKAGLPQPWRHALRLCGAEQIRHLTSLFVSFAWWRLAPAPGLLARQPGIDDPRRFVAAAQTADGSLAVVYVPQDRAIELNLPDAPAGLVATWFDPRTGSRGPASPAGHAPLRFITPAPGDWLLVLTRP